jgi:hypothetical protein
MGSEQSKELNSQDIVNIESEIRQQTKEYIQKRKEILDEALDQERDKNRKTVSELPNLELNQRQRKLILDLNPNVLQSFVARYSQIEEDCAKLKTKLIQAAIEEAEKETQNVKQFNKFSRLSEPSKQEVIEKLEKEKEIYQDKKEHIVKKLKSERQFKKQILNTLQK